MSNTIVEVVLNYPMDEHVATAGTPVEKSESNGIIEPMNVLQRGNMISPHQHTKNPMLQSGAQPEDQSADRPRDQPANHPYRQPHAHCVILLGHPTEEPSARAGEQTDAQPREGGDEQTMMY